MIDRRFPVSLAACAALALLLAPGCSSSREVTDESRLSVYLSVPLSGADAAVGKAIEAGARRALEEANREAAGVAVALEPLDVAGDGAPWDPVTVAANARTAAQDSTAIAYLGELESGATRTSLPITNDAGLLQVAPGSPAGNLVAPFEGSDEVPEETQPSGLRTFGRLADRSITEAKPAPAPDELGYRLIAVVLDSIGRARDPLSRGAVIEAFFTPGEHDSLAGSYSVDELGEIEFG